MLLQRDSLRPWMLLAVWVLASIGTYLLGFALVRLIARPLGKMNLVVSSILGIGLGIPPIFAQWIILRRYISQASKWIVVSILGWLVGTTLIFLSTSSSFGSVSLFSRIVQQSAFGAFIGISQWYVLRQHFPNAGWWVIASALGWGLMPLVIPYVIDTTLERIGWAAIPAMATGIALVLLLRQNRHPLVGDGVSLDSSLAAPR